MAEHYPELAYRATPETSDGRFEGTLALVASKSGVARRIPVRVVVPPGYPDLEPRAFDYTNKFVPHTSLRHFYSADGRCCLWLPWDSRWQVECRDALLDFMTHLAVFLNNQLVFEATGKWPTVARGHGRDGYREFLLERLEISPADFGVFIPLLTDGRRVAYLPCPCGSGKQAKRCHMVIVNRLISKIGRATLRDQVAWIAEGEDQAGGEGVGGRDGDSKCG